MIKQPKSGARIERDDSVWFQQWNQIDQYPAIIRIFYDLIFPNSLETFRNKSVLNAGCGCGAETAEISRVAKRVVAVDLNTAPILMKNLGGLTNVFVVCGDIASISFRELFDIVIAIGVIHHTPDPEKSFLNVASQVKKAGKLIFHVYAWEGSFLLRNFFDPVRKWFLSFQKIQRNLLKISEALASFLRPVIYLIWLLGIRRGKFEYIANLKALDFKSVVSHVYDKLNAPTVNYISREEIHRWARKAGFNDIEINSYKNAAWLCTATKGEVRG